MDFLNFSNFDIWVNSLKKIQQLKNNLINVQSIWVPSYKNVDTLKFVFSSCHRAIWVLSPTGQQITFINVLTWHD
jgi:hypothetical protein